MTPATLRVDSHVHLSRWWPELPRTAYRPDLDYTSRGLIEEMDGARIDVAIAIQIVDSPSTEDALSEGRSIAEGSGGRILPVGMVDPTTGEAKVRAALAAFDCEPALVGIKLFPGYRPFYPTDARLDPVYEYAHRRRVPVLIHLGDTLLGRGLLKFAHPLAVDEVAGRFRDVRFVLCHLGNPWIDEAAEVLYKNPNVYADTSGLLPPPSAPYFERNVERARERVLDAVVSTSAPDRFLLGSDWPLQSLRTSVALVEELDLTEADRAGIAGGNAARLFRIRNR